ncbi:MAG: hypothetical protein J6T16_07145, partial [Opitutales bacterium]|nr:hypothetical protein [Opitutales bacterium]
MRERAKKVDSLSKDLEMCSWIFAMPNRVNFVENELYREPFADPMPEAEAAMLKARQSAENPMALAGYAD